MLAPLQASARAGGFAAGHAAFVHGDFRHFVGQPLVRPGQAPPVVVSSAPVLVNRAFGFESLRHHRRFFGFGFPVGGIGVSYGPYPYEVPIVDVGAIARPSGTAPVAQDGDRSRPGDGCRSETRLVPSEAGGEQPITITWCRKG
jgi:hypothetical protein